MKSTDKLYIEGLDPIESKNETITFGQFVEEVLGAPFEEVYKDYILEEDIQHE